ncbi:lariat debranching enzyme, C-terminal domain-containing protein [Dichotomocladium elegans]|nr:lariat debranching enzyme, C-terminal domain-containing protein [Dichotomocladium elegans]
MPFPSSEKTGLRIPYDSPGSHKIAIEGCCHGELTKIYKALQERENQTNEKIDLLLICGDFQAIRNPADLMTMSVPEKYRRLGDFPQYYSGEKKAPYLTIFVGGNHEASGYMWELYYGGWVCENIYYLGAAGVVNYKGLRIGGISGIYNPREYFKGHYERFPYKYADLKTIYHIRDYEVTKLMQIKQPMDIFLSHDWPNGIEQCGDLMTLLRIKPYFRQEVQQGRLGNPYNTELLKKIKPQWWFAAHLHIGYPAIVDHAKEADSQKTLVKASPDQTENITRFLALDKCLPRRHYLEVIDIPDPVSTSNDLSYDLEWLAITRALQPYMSLEYKAIQMPSKDELERAGFAYSQELRAFARYKSYAMYVWKAEKSDSALIRRAIDSLAQNPQTIAFCELLGIDNDINPDAPVLHEEQSGVAEKTRPIDSGEETGGSHKRQKTDDENKE